MKPLRGFSLNEMVIALFILTAAIMIIFILFHQGLRQSTRAQQLATAIRIAESKIDEMRAWATVPANFNSAWAPYKAVSGPDPDQPAFTVSTDCEPAGLAVDSPCTTLEAPFADRRTLNTSVIPIRVQVSWHPTDPHRSVSLTSQVAAPTVSLDRLEVSPTGGDPEPLARDNSLTYSASLIDTSGNVVPDVMTEWSVEAIDGNATVAKLARSGTSSRLSHQYNFNPLTGTWAYVSGTVQVRARARYHGEWITGTGPLVELSP